MIRYIVIIVLNILDLLLTYIGIEKVDGIKETNPLANFVIQHGWEYAWLHKAIGVTFIIYFLEKIKSEKKSKRYSSVVCLVFSLICLWNGYQLLKALS
tara:strand:+ start:1616 stop:1909 length:294 start_codon:yes stop_codon:yes gene_type:complete